MFLGDCQEVAIQVGNVIEQTEGEGTPSVARLEHYCEVLYLLSRKMGTILPQELGLQLDEALGQAEKEIQQIKPRKEVFFSFTKPVCGIR